MNYFPTTELNTHSGLLLPMQRWYMLLTINGCRQLFASLNRFIKFVKERFCTWCTFLQLRHPICQILRACYRLGTSKHDNQGQKHLHSVSWKKQNYNLVIAQRNYNPTSYHHPITGFLHWPATVSVMLINEITEVVVVLGGIESRVVKEVHSGGCGDGNGSG